MTLYEQFKTLPMDYDALGLIQRGNDAEAYLCTPPGAEIIGWAGVDGIHYCFVPDYREIVFAVSPMNPPGENLHAIARSFSDLLGLLLACGDMAALEQAWQWSEAQFDRFLRDNPPASEALAAFEVLQDRLGVTSMERPYAYLQEVRESVDYDAFPFSAEYYDAAALQRAELGAGSWNVSYDGGFRAEDRAAGEEIPIGKAFRWNGEQWRVPAIYRCKEGLVLDLCRELDAQAVRTFFARWTAYSGAEDGLSPEQREQASRENPLNLAFQRRILLNRRGIDSDHGCSISWLPASVRREAYDADPEAAQVLTHYALDPGRPWMFYRASFPWPDGKPEPLKALILTLEQEPVLLPAEKFRAPAAGESILLHHPLTNSEYLLYVLKYEPYQLDISRMPADGTEYPTHCFAMRYTLTPELSEARLGIRDCAPGDAVRVESHSAEAASIGIIGGADGPTAIFLAAAPEHSAHTVFSSLHFAAPERVEWRADFREKLLPDIEIGLI